MVACTHEVRFSSGLPWSHVIKSLALLPGPSRAGISETSIEENLLKFRLSSNMEGLCENSVIPSRAQNSVIIVEV